jgi:Carboxypeptidase regulatory-like domain/TonB dependent receptor-like, beta-barrel/TonB-dependent Receptor Plug Domain
MKRTANDSLLVRALPPLLLLVVFSVPVRAQVAGGSILGTISSPTGGAMPGAQIEVQNMSTVVARIVKSDAAGFYSVPDLPAGSYEMKISAPGFVTQVRAGITVDVGSTICLNIAMQPGDAAKVVQQTATMAAACQASSALGGNVSSSEVRNTPLNGRDWTQLATLQAGVTGIQTGSSSTAGNAERGFGAALSISGARPDQNNYRLDGISINDYSNGAPGSVLGDNLGIDAVEQVSVLGSNYPAEYGRTSGGVINAVTRTGTNTLHGSLYEFLRNSSLDARNFFDKTIPPFRRNQFGGSAGGPIQKGRTFFFGDYEGLRQSLGITTVDTVPSVAARSGRLSTGAVAVDPEVARYLAAFFPLPNGPLLGAGDTGIFTFAGQQVTNEDYFTGRVDHKFSERDGLYGTYMHDSSETVQPDTFNELRSNIVSRRQVVTLHQQHVFSPAFLNAVRAGFNRAVGIQGDVTSVLNPALRDPSYAFIPGQFVGIIQSVPGVTAFGGGPSIYNTIGGSKTFHWNSFQAGDDAFLTRGGHAVTFGVDVERMQDNEQAISNVNGSFRFSTLANFLTNVPQNFQGAVPIPVQTYGMRETLFGAYAQDDVKLRPNLTLNLGLRYEMATVPSEEHGRLSNLLHLTDAQPHLGSPFFQNPTLRNFEPRLGFAWNAHGNTLVRGGFGIFDVLPLTYEFNNSIPFASPFAERIYANVLPAGSFPTGAYNEFASQSTSSQGVYVEDHPKRDYVMQWNVSVARELTPTLAVTVGYIGSRGVHQPYRMDNIDMVLPTLTPAGYVFPSPATSQVLNPNFGRISANMWQGNSFYDALQADLTKRTSHGFEFHVAYTFGKSIDTLSATVANDAFPNGVFNPLFFDQRTSRGLSDFDVRHNFVASYTWELPSPAWHSKLPRWGFSGWQLGGVLHASSGQPFTPILGGDPAGMKLDQTSEPPDLISGPGCQTLTNPGDPNHYIKTQCLDFPAPVSRWGTLGRNTIIGPGIVTLDFSVFKNNHIRRISENFNVQFRAEFFNVLNRANFSSPTDNLNIFDQNGNPIPSAGLITSTQTPSRQIQFALKLTW